MVKRTERGWAGHYICSDKCLYRRNTLIEENDKKIIISSVGGYVVEGKLETIAAGGRYYETIAFYAKKQGCYYEIDVKRPVPIKGKVSICAKSPKNLPDDVDNQADEMHENAIAEIIFNLSSINL